MIMMNCLLTCCDYRGIIVTLMGVCAVFVTVSPIVYDRRYKRLMEKIQSLEKEIDDLKKEVSPLRKKREDNDAAMQAGMKEKNDATRI